MNIYFTFFLIRKVRPRFMEIREKKKDKSFWWIMKAVFRGGYDMEEERKKKHSIRLEMIRSSNKGISIKDVNAVENDGDILQKGSVSALKQEDISKDFPPCTAESNSSIDTTGQKKDTEDISIDVNSDRRNFNNTPLLMKSPDQLHENRAFLDDTSPFFKKTLNEDGASLDDEVIVGIPNNETLHPIFLQHCH